jgi:hypothetical protein
MFKVEADRLLTKIGSAVIDSYWMVTGQLLVDYCAQPLINDL